jgi:hypothetical protein
VFFAALIHLSLFLDPLFTPSLYPLSVSLGHNPTNHECNYESDNPYPIFDFGRFDKLLLRKGLGFPIVGVRESEPNSKCLFMCFSSIVSRFQFRFEPETRKQKPETFQNRRHGHITRSSH